MVSLPTRQKPPFNVSVIERWLGEASRHTGIAAGRLRRWVGFMVIAGMLERARHAGDGHPLFLIKGGVAMELRFDAGARATKDLDTALRDRIEAVTDHLDPALRSGYGDFTATRTELEPVRNTQTLRCDLKLAYRGKPFATVQLEVAEAEGGIGTEIDLVPAKALDHIGLAGPDLVPCITIRWQIAQKLHACTETVPGVENERFRDLVDLQLLERLVKDEDWARVRAACIQLFDKRRTHSWPPTLTIPTAWRMGYRTLAIEIGFAVIEVTAAAERVRAMIGRIEQASAGPSVRGPSWR